MGLGSTLYGEAGQEAGLAHKIGDGFSIPAMPRVIYTLGRRGHRHNGWRKLYDREDQNGELPCLGLGAKRPIGLRYD